LVKIWLKNSKKFTTATKQSKAKISYKGKDVIQRFNSKEKCSTKYYNCVKSITSSSSTRGLSQAISAQLSTALHSSSLLCSALQRV
jgi:curli biogenesis system outer membrane secretion channel CsgG